jgi:transcription initiation factor TFIIA large subunit
VPSNVKSEQQYKSEQFKAEQPSSNAPVQRPAQPSNEPAIKQEQGIKYEAPQNYQPQQGYGALNPQFASERANTLMQQHYGSHADASIRASQAQAQAQAQARQMQQGTGGGQQRPTHIQMPPRPGQPQYPQQQPQLSTAQNDGANDDALAEWRAAVAERRAVSEQDRTAADHQLRDYLQRTIALEEGSILLPASSQLRKSKKSRKLPPSTIDGESSSATRGPSEFDGADDEDSKENVRKHPDDDEDAINSDLDDSEEEADNVDDDEAEGALGETILCTYDKVQRVKNKVRPYVFLMLNP